MEEAEEPRHGDVMQRARSSAGASPSSVPKPGFASPHSLGPCRQFSPVFGPDPGGKRPAGIPPAHPHLHPQIPSPGAGGGLPHPGFGSSHSRSLSQPAFFSLESLPHLGSSPFGEPSPSPASSSSSSAAAGDVSGLPPPLARPSSGRVSGAGLPPRKAHRRSQSDIPLGLFQSSPPPPPPRPAPPTQFVKQESEGESSGEGIGDRDAGDELFNAYMNLDSFDTLNSSGTEGKCGEDLDSRASGTRTNGADSSENEAESSSVNESGSSARFRTPQAEGKEGNKRSATADLTPASSRHVRSLSMDSLMRKLHFGDESPKLPPSPGTQAGLLSRSGSLDGTTGNLSLELGSSEFSPAEVKKIMANEKLAEMALTDPKRVKRILANRQSAARSKERKMRYISELEHKVQTLQTEATTLSAQLTLLQRDSAGLTSQNNELKFRLQAMEQQAQLRDALNDALTTEVQRLKLVTGEITEAQLSKSINQQMSMNSQMFQLQQLHSQQQQQQSGQVPLFQFQSQHQAQQQQQNHAAAKLESNK